MRKAAQARARRDVEKLVKRSHYELVADDDTALETDGVTLVVDPMSLQYLVGSVVDYTEGLEGSRFVVNNPNATATCGCGSSFSI